MRIEEIIEIIGENFFLAFIAVVVLVILFYFGYFIVYRKLLGGNKKISKRQLLVGTMLMGYVIMVIGVTFLGSRGSNYQGWIGLSLFNSYREAWHNASVRHWQFVILNIVMFVPLGTLLPLLHAIFQKIKWTVGVAIIFTLSIESFQYVTGFGIFDVDDLLNNVFGAIIGYGIIMGFTRMRSKGFQQVIKYNIPLILIVFLFSSLLTYYHLKEFGNLSIVPNKKVDMTQVTTILDIELEESVISAPIYKAPVYTKEEGDLFATTFFEKKGIHVSDMETIYYQNEGIYRNDLRFKALGGSYDYTDFSIYNEGMKPKDVDEETLINRLMDLDIVIPQDTFFKKMETGAYKWNAPNIVSDNQLIDGELTVRYYEDDTIKSIENRLITYDKIKNIEMKSELEAYEELVSGNFHTTLRMKK
ncbi:VanZ family protein [Sutcliffiella rhizosphaerae]|uniref:VanZ-like domain-containing protein n=1 Tax=Sutcliffiella rhizosphaerae TaxID=2880967 RepID=A0ABN8A9J9_9BACI|nr:VanZ family protein [Sutcliffiella rhizosphaerae]CAG9620292.1 hypothetical protein BACCIP111883_01060 [Sutcliffiella rhizosphaerae]